MTRLPATILAGAALLACAPSTPKPAPQRTLLSGAVAARTFEGASAAFSVEDGPPRGIVVRVTTRPDTCEAAADPSDAMDPSLLIALVPDQAGTFDIVAPGAAAGARYATATLFTFADVPDGGVPADAGPARVTRGATGGTVVVRAYDPSEGGRLDADVVLQFGDAGYVGPVGASPCARVR